MSFFINDAEVLKKNYQDSDTHEIWSKIIGPRVQAEKAGYMKRQLKWAKENYDKGSQMQEGMGQKVGTVDLATYVRWQQEVPGCWKDPGFVKQFVAANPECGVPTRSKR